MNTLISRRRKSFFHWIAEGRVIDEGGDTKSTRDCGITHVALYPGKKWEALEALVGTLAQMSLPARM
jgi:hypothetical protein